MIVENKEFHSRICVDALENAKSVFSPLSSEEKQLLLEQMIAHEFKKGEVIYRVGEKPDGVLYLVHGKAKIAKAGIGGREQIVRMAGVHSFIGYRALFAEEESYASATTLEETFLVQLPFETVVSVIRSNSDFALALLKSFATDLRFAENRTVTLTQKHIRGRLAESLLLLHKEYGVGDDEQTLQVLLSREDVAKFSNMTPSNAIRTLSAFAQEGVIALEGRAIKILNIDELERISRLG
ncbi:CRP-like cAMP-binding protein [Balneicella halophila]|uniref:CRP-like cAMP-binding protein n=1 Tax=Balneicella halophila TaxID=1537566 RepID=A0A7L4URT5_BALHA|nr:Crp/Fnr family transcriptional regulator [Balneicella halophila]PVX52486.1 CRP-like cAMP-binding protein [Balneicella halophila]